MYIPLCWPHDPCFPEVDLSMLALFLGLLLTITAPASADDWEECIDHLPVEDRDELLVGDLPEAQRVWTQETGISADSLRASISALRRARSCARSLPPSDVENPALVVRTFYWETFLRAALRQFPQAFAAFDEAVSYLENDLSGSAGADLRTEWLSILHQDRAYLHFLLGDLSASIGHYLQAYQTTPATKPGQRVQFLTDVGILHLRVRDYATARHYFDRADRLLRDSDLSPDERKELRARTYQMQADLLLGQLSASNSPSDELERARSLLQAARADAEPGTEQYARISTLLSESHGYLGNLDSAYRLNEEARRYAQSHDDVRLRTFSELKLGVLHVQMKRWSRADSTLHAALARAQELGDLDYQRRILRSLGRLYELQDHWRKAESYYRKGVGVVEEYRESLTASQWSTTAFAQWRDVHRGLVRSLLAQDRPREALTALDRSRARHLEDLRTRARVSNQLPPAERTRLDSLSRALTDVRNRLSEPIPDTAQATLRNREAALMAARQQLLQIDSNASRLSVDQIHEMLRGQDRALVSYFLDDPSPVYDRQPRSVAFVLTGDSLRTVPLPNLTQDSVQTHVEAISPLFTSRGKPDRTNAMHFDLRPLHRLHDAVYAPVAEHLPEDHPITVVPDGSLFHLPFSMLVDSMPGGRYAPADARYVLHDRPVSTELASSLLVDASRKSFDWSQFEPQVAAYGVSEFDTLKSVPRPLRTAIPESLSDSSLALPSLPGVQRELRSVQSTIPDAQIALDEQASEAAFCRDARTAGVLHVASHAFVNASSPLQNAILLRSEERSSGATDAGTDPNKASPRASDGILFLHELQEQQTRIPMVVLSGCNTASGTLRGGEGMEGLQYAFRAMGAQSTVSTLWPVADAASVELMEAFYGHLQEGRPKDVALRQAQLDFLESNPQKASPFFWAPPVLYGSPAALPLDGPFLPTWAWWGLGAGAVFLTLLLGGWLWFRPPLPLWGSSS